MYLWGTFIPRYWCLIDYLLNKIKLNSSFTYSDILIRLVFLIDRVDSALWRSDRISTFRTDVTNSNISLLTSSPLWQILLYNDSNHVSPYWSRPSDMIERIYHRGIWRNFLPLALVPSRACLDKSQVRPWIPIHVFIPDVSLVSISALRGNCPPQFSLVLFFFPLSCCPINVNDDIWLSAAFPKG